MTNREKIREIFPNVLFIYHKENEKTKAIMCSDEWLDSEYIEPLEQEPTTKNDLGDDCISRFEVTEIINAEWDIDIILDRIEALPTVTPQEPRKGHWIDSSNGWMCSECNKDNTFDTNYCPKCGARMVEPQESGAADDRKQETQQS